MGTAGKLAVALLCFASALADRESLFNYDEELTSAEGVSSNKIGEQGPTEMLVSVLGPPVRALPKIKTPGATEEQEGSVEEHAAEEHAAEEHAAEEQHDEEQPDAEHDEEQAEATKAPVVNLPAGPPVTEKDLGGAVREAPVAPPLEEHEGQGKPLDVDEEGGVGSETSCESLNDGSFAGAVKFAEYKIKNRNHALNSTQTFVCEDVHEQILSEPSIYIRGHLDPPKSGEKKTLYVIQIVLKNDLVEEDNLPPNARGESESTFSDRKIEVSHREIPGSHGAKGDPEEAHFAREMEQPDGKDLDTRFEMRMLKELGEHSSAAIPPSLVKDINEKAAAGKIAWTAKLYPDTMTMTLAEARKTKFGHHPLSVELLSKFPTAPAPTVEGLAAVPGSYDPRTDEVTMKCGCWEPENQGSCGSCFTFAAALVYSARMCRKSGARVNIDIAEQDYLSCHRHMALYLEGDAIKADGEGSAANGCDGGNPITVWILQNRAGRVVRRCNPYVGKSHLDRPCGSRTCENPMLYKGATKVYMAAIGNIAATQSELYTNGPLYASMDAYSDFMSYKAGVYHKSADASSHGGHAVSLIGWGNEGTMYWLVANSWGRDWGEGGYFRIAPGEVNFGRELFAVTVASADVCAGKPSCEHGDFKADCTCHCAANWKASTPGGPCTESTLSCANGGTKTAAGKCECAMGYFGDSCENYVLGYWAEAEGNNAKIEVKWSFSTKSWKAESRVRRFAALPSTANAAITGTTKAATSPLGSMTIEQKLDSTIPGYVANTYAYSFELNLGANEFGASKGYAHMDLPVFSYDPAKKCFKGGNTPPTGSSSVTMCSGAGGGTAAGAGSDEHMPPIPVKSAAPTGAPTAVPTEQPSQTPTAAPTDVPAEPATHPPTAQPTATPTETPTAQPSETPTESPMEAPVAAPANAPAPSSPGCAAIVDKTNLKTTNCPCATIEFTLQCHDPPANWGAARATEIHETMEATADRAFGDICSKISDVKPSNCPAMLPPAKFGLVKKSVECMPSNGENADHELALGNFNSAADCAKACKAQVGCQFYVIGQGGGEQPCFWEYTKACDDGHEPADFDLYKLS